MFVIVTVAKNRLTYTLIFLVLPSIQAPLTYVIPGTIDDPVKDKIQFNDSIQKRYLQVDISNIAGHNHYSQTNRDTPYFISKSSTPVTKHINNEPFFLIDSDNQ